MSYLNNHSGQILPHFSTVRQHWTKPVAIIGDNKTPIAIGLPAV